MGGERAFIHGDIDMESLFQTPHGLMTGAMQARNHGMYQNNAG